MKNFIRAEDVFKDLPDERKSEIFAVAQGKLVYFAKIQNKRQNIDTERVLIDYIKGKTYREIAEESGTNIMRICRVINKERGMLSAERIKFWRDKGLVYRELSRLYKISHETIRQVVESKKGEL